MPHPSTRGFFYGDLRNKIMSHMCCKLVAPEIWSTLWQLEWTNQVNFNANNPTFEAEIMSRANNIIDDYSINLDWNICTEQGYNILK